MLLLDSMDLSNYYQPWGFNLANTWTTSELGYRNKYESLTQAVGICDLHSIHWEIQKCGGG